jgi:hypothetical protein
MHAAPYLESHQVSFPGQTKDEKLTKYLIRIETMSFFTQEIFDEAVLENEECFDLTPNEAVVETVNQFIKQCRQAQQSSLPHADQVNFYLGNLLLSHPNSERGRWDREQKEIFLNFIADVCHYESDSLSPSHCVELSQKITCYLKNIQDFCSSPQHFLSKDSEISTATSLIEPEFGPVVSTQEHEIPGTYVTDLRRVYLKLFQTNRAMDAIFSILKVTLQSANFSSLRMHFPLIESIIDTTISIFQQQQYLEVKLLMDSFGGWDEITTLLDGLGQLYSNFSRAETVELIEGKIDSDKAMAALLPKVYQLCHLSLKGCEKNKVQFVQSRSSFQGCYHREGYSAYISSKKNSVHVIIQTLVSLSSSLKYTQGDSGESEEDATPFVVLTLTRVCNTISAACRCDDKSCQVSSSHDHAMEFYRAGAVKVLHNILCAVTDLLAGGIKFQEEVDGPPAAMFALLCAVMSAIRVTCINDEIVQRWVSVGLLKSMQDVLAIAGCSSFTLENKTTNSISSSPFSYGEGVKMQLLVDAMGVIRNICANDDIKTTICQDGRTLPLLLMHGMRHFCNVPLIQEHGCGIIAAMALRSFFNVQRMMADYEVGRDITAALRYHPTNAKVQRQGALAIRNIASRGDVDLKKALLDLGVEDVLKNITGKLSDSVEEAYAALRDLGVQVSMIHYTVDDDGRVIRSGTVQMFGEDKPKFRAIFEPTHVNIENMISKHQ